MGKGLFDHVLRGIPADGWANKARIEGTEELVKAGTSHGRNFLTSAIFTGESVENDRANEWSR